MCCIGSPLYLKKVWGRGYQFSISDGNDSYHNSFVILEKFFKNCKHISSHRGTHFFEIDGTPLEISKALQFSRRRRGFAIIGGSISFLWRKFFRRLWKTKEWRTTRTLKIDLKIKIFKIYNFIWINRSVIYFCFISPKFLLNTAGDCSSSYPYLSWICSIKV